MKNKSIISVTRKFKLPVTWEMSGTVEVYAASLEQALENFDGTQHDLPDDAEYVDGSLRLTYTDASDVELFVGNLS